MRYLVKHNIHNQALSIVNAETEKTLITIKKPKWYRRRYTFSYRGHQYLIQKRGFFGESYELLKDGRPRGHFDQVRRLSTSPQLKLDIILKTGEIKRYFMLKLTNRGSGLMSHLSTVCIIKDEEDESILEISGVMKQHFWFHVTHDVMITVLNPEATHLELLVCAKFMLDVVDGISAQTL